MRYKYHKKGSGMKNNKNIVEKFFSTIKTLFLNGLFALLPITATIFFVHFTYHLILKWLTPLKKIQPTIISDIPGSEIVLVILFIIFVGVLLKFIIITPLTNRIEKIITKIPLIRTVYSASKTVVDFFNVPDPAAARKKVVLIEFMRPNNYTIGFQLELGKDSFQQLLPVAEEEKKEFVKVFVPSSPAPTTGYFLIVPREKVIETDITFEEAIKVIVSCGLITPESIQKMKK
jgi:uncharacterized membrane protein